MREHLPARPGADPWPARAGRWLAGVLRSGLGRLLPCPGCGVRSAGTEGVCATCRRRATAPGRLADRLWLGAYHGPLGRLVRALKYRGATRLAGWLGAQLGREVARAGWRPQLVCAVPLHPSRQRQRGFNHAELLAREAARQLGVPYRRLLRRTRPTPQQTRLDREARRRNVRGAFVSLPARGASVLLIDDVWTTGATAEACRQALATSGAGPVWVAVIALSGSHAGSVRPPPTGAGPTRR